MSFRKMQEARYPPRLWALVGYPGAGKSTFATQMRGPILAIDADQRFKEVLDLAGEREVYELSEVAADNTNPDRIAGLLDENMPGAVVGTIVVDSLTAIIAPIVTQTLVDKDQGREKNLAAGWRRKALAMRQLQDAVSRWGTDCLWIYHLQDARDARAKKRTRKTLSRTERARLHRSLNLQLEIVESSDRRRGVKVAWARRGRDGMILWDDSGCWHGMPAAIEAAVYDGLSKRDRDALEGQAPEVFPDPAAAINWGFEQGCFNALQHARNAYDALKREEDPQNAREMVTLWTAEVERRVLEQQSSDG
jgi:adenylate kinase family enzyme